jgi:hypothetical protein
MVPFESTTVIDDYVRNLEMEPPSYEEREGRPVYKSRPDFGWLRKGVRFLQISDFGLAACGDVSSLHNHLIQPLQLRAPEVILKAGWTYSADIWNLGMVVRLFGTSIIIPCNDTDQLSSRRCGKSWREFHCLMELLLVVRNILARHILAK